MVAIEFITFVGKGLHADDALQGLLDDCGRVGKAILRFPGNLARLAAEDHGRYRQDRKAHEHDARQLEGGDGDERDAANQYCDLAKELRQDGDQCVLNLNEVAGKTAGQLAHPPLSEKGHGERDQSCISIAAQID